MATQAQRLVVATAAIGVLVAGRPHYGTHGTSEPGRVGHTTSHGCARLTNWDASAVAGMVTKGTKTKVVFAE